MSKEKQDKKPTKASRYLDDKYIVETIYHNKTPKFAIVNGTGPEIKGFVKPNSETWLQPFPDPFNNLSKNIVLLPSDIEDYISEENLLQDIKTFISNFAYLPDFWLDVATYYVLMTWVYDAFGAVPYLDFLGDKDSGKTRIGYTIASCCYSTIIITGAATVSPMFRLIDRYQGTMFIDEADYKDSELDTMIAKVLNCGYKYGEPVLRTDKFEGDFETRGFNVYGPKIISHRRPFGDTATSSRCLTYHVPIVFDLPKHIPAQLLPGLKNPFELQSVSIRNKCLKYRLDNIRTIVPDMESSNLVSSRSREISIPMMTVIKDLKFKKQFIEFIGDTAKEKKEDSDIAVCIKIIRKHYKTYKGIGVAMYLKGITEDMNQLGADEERQWSGKAVGGIVRSLGLHTEKKGKDHIFRVAPTTENDALLTKLFHEYEE